MALSGLFDEATAKTITAAFTKGEYETLEIKEKVTPLTLKQVASSFAVKRNAQLDLTGIVEFTDGDRDEVTSLYTIDSSAGEGIPFKFPVYCSRDIDITAGDLDMESGSTISNLYVDENGNHHLVSKLDVCRYLCNFMNGGFDNYVSNIWKRNSRLF